MRHELSADQEVIGRMVAERIAHMTVPAGNAAAVADQLQQAVFLFLVHIAEFRLMRRPCTGPDRNDQVDIGQRGGIGERLQRMVDIDAKTLGREKILAPVTEIRWIVTLPAPDEQRSFHGSSSRMKFRIEAMSREGHVLTGLVQIKLAAIAQHRRAGRGCLDRVIGKRRVDPRRFGQCQRLGYRLVHSVDH